jgi:DNA polymerase-2
VEEFVRAFVADLRAGRFDGELAYRKAVRKDLDAYVKTTPPHVRAARLRDRPGGRIVSYTMTINGPEPAGRATAPPDYPHYVDHQLRPIADAILRFLDSDFDVACGAPRQLALF